ncbi:GIY-YIG nuclease family protein [Chloroflexota bacterium]
MEQFCARWGCNNKATYDKPLCHDHWLEWQGWCLEECNRCHQFYDGGDSVLYETSGDEYEEYPYMCDDCLKLTLYEDGKLKPAEPGKQGPTVITEPERKPVFAHADIKREIRYVYILKLSDGTFYAGQTKNLSIRLKEHKDGAEVYTRGKDPKLVYYEIFEGMREIVDKRERELIAFCLSGLGHRKIRYIIEEFRAPLKLLDLEI